MSTAGSPIPVKDEDSGLIYPSLKACLESHGLKTHGTDYTALHRGRLVQGLHLTPLSPDHPDWKWRPCRRGTGRGRSKRVRCVETGEVFVSAVAASETVNRSPSAIQAACRIGRASAGLHWVWE